MEDSLYTELKGSLSSVPAKALNYSSRLILANNLDVKQVLTSKSGHARDYRGFAELMGFQYNDIKRFEQFHDPTMKILESWETRSGAMLGKLVDYLEEMDRHDIIHELIPLLEKNAETFQHSLRLQEIPIQVPEVTSCPVSIPQIERDIHTCHELQTGVIPCPVSMQIEKDFLTRDDIRTQECTIYDAYVSYADEDSGFVSKLSRYLESKEIGIKLFIRGRDMLAGCPELDTNIELIKNRCRKMLIVLTPSFTHSPHCEFQVSFAASLAIEQRERILVPIVIDPCDVPTILLRVSKIDFTKPGIYEWMWEKLITSLLPQSRNLNFITPLERFPKLEPVDSDSSIPMITYPETTKQLANSIHKSASVVSLIEVPVELPTEVPVEFPTDVPVEVSSGVPIEVPSVVVSSTKNAEIATVPSKSKTSKKWKFSFRSRFKKEYLPSSASSSDLSSDATSGFHSESTASENFECFNESDSNN